jgi:hypothetical protein
MTSDSVAPPGGTLADIKQKLDAAQGGPSVQANVKRHYEHLETLAINLRKLGMDEHTISDELMHVFEQYERALTDYIKAA